MPKLSQAATDQIQNVLETSIKGTGVPGLVFCAVDKSGDYLTQQHAGTNGPISNQPLDQESVFWIASCTKMITGIACLQLVEQRRLELDSSKQLYELLPEVRDKQQVLVGKGQWEPRKGDITLRMLLAHTAGFGYTFFNTRIRDYGRPTGFQEPGGDFKDVRDSPLINQPGSRWEYGTNVDWAGLCVERVSGMKLGDYFQRHIFETLGVKDIAVFPDQHMREHMVGCAQRYPDGSVEEIDQVFRRAIYAAEEPEDRSRTFQGGGHCCFAKPKEYCKIIMTLLNNGTSPATGEQILKHESVDEMFTNQVPQFPRFSYEQIPDSIPRITNKIPALYPQPDNPDQGWGLTFHITKEPGQTGRGANTGWWAGVANLFWWCDREKGVGGMIASQILPFLDNHVLGAWEQCEATVYQDLAGAPKL